MPTKENEMNYTPYIKIVLEDNIANISNVKIMKHNIHGPKSCPHCEIQFEICPDSDIVLYPLRDSRFNNLIDKLTILPSENESIRFKANINLETIKRSYDIITNEEN